jgi:hypothetical protein
MAKDTRGHYREHVFRVFQGIGDAVMMVMGQPWPTIGCGEMYFFCRLGASVFFFPPPPVTARQDYTRRQCLGCSDLRRRFWDDWSVASNKSMRISSIPFVLRVLYGPKESKTSNT